jgi:hypothetical protein
MLAPARKLSMRRCTRLGMAEVPVDCGLNEMLDLEIAHPHGLQFDFGEGASHVCSIVRTRQWPRPSESRTAGLRWFSH